MCCESRKQRADMSTGETTHNSQNNLQYLLSTHAFISTNLRNRILSRHHQHQVLSTGTARYRENRGIQLTTKRGQLINIYYLVKTNSFKIFHITAYIKDVPKVRC